MSNRDVAAASAAGASGHSWAGYSGAQSQQGNLEMGKAWGGHHEVEGRDTVRWDKHLGPGSGRGAYLHRPAQLLTSSRLAGHDPDPHLGICHEGGRAGPEGAQRRAQVSG